MLATFVVLAVVAGATGAIAFLPQRKEAVALAAVAVLVALGQVMGFFTADRAFAAISMPVLVILLAIGIFATVFAASGAFERACRVLAILAGGDHRRLVPAFLLLTYVLSALLPNLTCLYVLLPLMIGALRAVGIADASLKRVLVAIVIASNLGGASTMIGDFPNILISRSQGIAFLDFIWWMTPACVLMLGVLVGVTCRFASGHASHPVSRTLMVCMIAQRAEHMRVDLRLFLPAAATFGLMLAGLIITGWFPFPPELVCLLAAALCVWLLPHPEQWATRLDVQSTLFIACLFIFAGAIQATGLLERVAAAVVAMSGDDPYRLSAAVIIMACLLTAAFSAGPTTAVLIPVAAALGERLPGHLEWWCLSLGVLAGSSSTLLSATAGPIAVNLLKQQTDLELTYADFLRLGAVMALAFCLIGIAYVWCRLALLPG